MGNLTGILKSKNILLAIGLVILIFLVIFLGSIIRITWLMRIAIVVFIIMIFIIVLLFKRMKEAQKAAQIEQSMSYSSDSSVLSPEKRSEIDQFKKQIEAAITALKNSKLGRGKSGKAALYKLPWYMIIGPSAAGKTTAIQNSGLEFPYGKESIKGVGGTRNCDWFFSTRAIFLDTAGRYVSETEDRPEWLAFLEILKKNRKKKPINGVIIALNVDEIIKCENDQLYEHSSNIRKRIDELIENLGIVFPVYFVFTKCDLIQGFVDFFGDFSETERSQIWGATLTTQQQLDSNIKAIFENEFNKLFDVIHKAKTIRLSNPLKREQRRKVFLFPFQFRSLKEKLTYLIGEVFQTNPYQDNPLFRGFYFTSGTQEGVPLDLAIREIAKQFNLPPAPSEQFEDIIETKNYFIKDLLNDVVIGDQNYSVGQAATVIKQNRNLKFATISASIILFFIFSILITISFIGSSDALETISSSAVSFTELNWSGDLLRNFSEAESLRQSILKIKAGEFNETPVHFGLDRSDKTLEELNKLYLKKTQPFFTKYVFDEILNTLNSYATGQEFSGEKIYNYLKAYLLLGNERSRIDTTTQKFLTGVFTGILNSRFINSNSIASSRDKDSLKTLFRNYITFVTEQLHNEKVYTVRNDNSLINILRLKFKVKPNAESIYARLKENGLSQFPAELTFEQMIEGKSGQIIRTDFRIPYIFSSNGWKNYFKPSILDESKNPGKEDWVTGKTQTSKTLQSEFDSKLFEVQLTDLYIKDFSQFWIQFLQSLNYTGFESVPYSVNSLKLLSDPVSSPLVLILKVFADQLKGISNPEVIPDTNNSDKPEPITSNNLDLKRFRRFIEGPDDGSAPPDLGIVIMQYGLLYNKLEEIKGDQGIIKDYAVSIMNQQAIEFQTSLKTISGAIYNLPELQNLFIEPVKMSLRSVFSGATSYINQQWQLKVVDAYNKMLANTFPFSEIGNDAPIQDFDEFFNPQNGILWSFFDSELSPFIKKENWRVNLSGNEGLSFSKDFINSLKKADEISSILFRGGNLNFSFRLKPQLPVSKMVDGNKATVLQYYLKIDDIVESYKMGSPSETSYIWPSHRGTPGTVLYIILNEFGTSETKSFEGEWSLFRLINEASISRGNASSQLILNWNFSKPNQYDVDVIYVLNAGSSRHPFSKNFFKSFRLPKILN